ncbi:LysR substrate-binding domain-containing protein [Jiella avicenniae]|uniref:LysR substrate-binding domain-containing protein n=1 Tax=Jiella avicenniae TaxID=2907202 RepID=A0A9X1P1E4_9HYPH|nr:LysR substrate-binding domain-containing protein [Jiella avicenniae]MCE7029617.1 LysR substrate-binding domain-containing protein [Jiella avicenniae]
MRQLQTLIAIADHGTFARAAEVVHITPSAVSQQILALENEIGVPLFNRETRPPTLNLQGMQLLETARSILRQIQDTRAVITEGRTIGSFSIGSVRTSAIGLLPLAIVSLRKAYPELKISLKVGLSAALIADVLADRLDMAIVAEHVGVPRSLTWEPFIREPLVVIAPKDTPHEDARAILENVPFVRFRSLVPLANMIDTELARLGIVTQDTAEIDTITTIVECVAAGLGAGIVPDIALRGLSTPLKVVPFGDPQIYRQIGIVRPGVSPKAAFFDDVHTRLMNLAGPYGVPTARPRSDKSASGPAGAPA